MADLVQELDSEVASWLSQCYAASTKTTYASHRQAYLNFCLSTGCTPVPATTTNICRFVAFLGRSKSYNSVKQYLNIVRVIHLELNLPNPLLANYMVKSVLQGMRRVKGDAQLQKEPFSPEILLRIRSCLQLHSVADAQFWAALLACFFGLMRVGSVCVKSLTTVVSPHILARKDFSFAALGCCILLRGSKTIQFQQRIHQASLPFFKDHPLCPATAVLGFFQLGGKYTR